MVLTILALRASVAFPSFALNVSCIGTPNPASTYQAITWQSFVTGGNGTYSYYWTGNGSFPYGATDPSVVAYYHAAGQKNANVTVTSGSQSATGHCSVIVNSPPPPPPVSCAPSTQTATANSVVSFSTSGGDGTYNWSLPGGNPSSASGSAVSATFPSAGTYSVTVTSGGQTAACTVNIT